MSLLPLIEIDMLFNSRPLFYLPNSNLTSAVSIFAHESHCFPFRFSYFLLPVKEPELLLNLMYTWMHECFLNRSQVYCLNVKLHPTAVHINITQFRCSLTFK